MKTFFAAFIMFMISMLLTPLGCDKKEQGDSAGAKARQEAAATVCLGMVDKWCTEVKGNVKMQVTSCVYASGLYQETDEVRSQRVNAFASTTAFTSPACGNRAVKTRWTFECQVKRNSTELVRFKVIEPNGKLPYEIVGCAD